MNSDSPRVYFVDSDELFRRESTLEEEYDHDQIEGGRGQEICRWWWPLNGKFGPLRRRADHYGSLSYLVDSVWFQEE